MIFCGFSPTLEAMPSRYTTAHTNNPDSSQAGKIIGREICDAFNGESPDAVIVFASSRHDHEALLESLQSACMPKTMVGCSSAGEFTVHAYEEGSVSAMALLVPEWQFAPAIGRGLRGDRNAAARELISSFQGLKGHDYPYRSALVLTDALAGRADNLVEQLTFLTSGSYQLFGGGAGDDANFTCTKVFYGTEVVPDAAVALEILSDKPIGIGVQHGWKPGSDPMRVTEADGMRLVSLDNSPVTEVFQEYAESTGQTFDPADPIPFFLHNVIGISTPAGFKLRVPLAILPDAGFQCAADIPVGATVHIMAPVGQSAHQATRQALQQLGDSRPGMAMFFDCVATRLRLGRDFGFELNAVRDALGGIHYAGCNTYGQIARAEGQFSGFHNCTAVIAILPA